MSKDIAQVRANILYQRDPDKAGTDEEYRKVINLVIITDEADYKYNSEGNILRDRKLEAHRFNIYADQWHKFRETVEQLIEASEEELN